MSKKNALRINVGGDKDRSTEVWRFWVNGDDVYFFSRSMSHELHISLHQSGVWKFDIDKKRHYLNREIPAGAGWGVGPGLLFPNLKVNRLPVKGTHLEDKRIIMLPAAEPDRVRVIQVIYEREKAGTKIHEFCSSYLKLQIDWHASLKLKTSGNVHLVSYVFSPPDDLLGKYYSFKNETKIYYKDSVPEGGMYVNMFLTETPIQKNVQSRIVTIPIGSENLYVDHEK